MKRLIFILLITHAVTTLAQQKGAQINVQELIEELFQPPDSQIDYEEKYESLYQLYTNPIDLNHTTKEELNSLYQLSIYQINQLLSYLHQYGPLLSIYELQVIKGFDINTINKIIPFVEIKSSSSRVKPRDIVKRISKEENKYFIFRIEQILEGQEGYARVDSSRFLGSRQKIYGRFRSTQSKEFSLGLTFEKDQAERITLDKKNRQYGFDYYSAHLLLENKWKFRKIIIGDYQLQFGQGLIIGSGFNPGKGAETITTIKRNNSGISPYTSAKETGFLRGVAMTFQIGNFNISPYYSHQRQDGTMLSKIQAGRVENYVSAIGMSGLHRTYNELNSKKTIKEQTFGINVTYKEPIKKNLEIGINYIQNQFSNPIYKTPSNYNQFEFQGYENFNVGFFGNFNWENFIFFSEFAISKSGGTAMIGGFLGSLSPRFSMSLLYRNYDKNYHSFYAKAFGENSRVINEQGIYWGLKYDLHHSLSIAGYFDNFTFPWLKYGVNSPSKGYEFLVRTDYRPLKKIAIYAQIREESKERSVFTENSNQKALHKGLKRTYTGNINLKVNNRIGLKSRIQFSSFKIDHQHTKGMAIIQDLVLTFSKIVMSARVALFDTEDYENRQYVYERDLLYVFSIPSYAGQGTRNYIMIQYKPNRKISLWVRYGKYNYRNIDSIGSALNRITGSTKSDVKFQLKLKF